MVPTPDDPVTPGQARDPVRFMVHVALALYLSPVILAVCVVGGGSILVSRAARLARRGVRKPDDRADRRGIGIIDRDVSVHNAQRGVGRRRSQIVR